MGIPRGEEEVKVDFKIINVTREVGETWAGVHTIEKVEQPERV